MKTLLIILAFLLSCYACEPFIVWIIYRPNCERIWSITRWKWRVKDGGTIKITKDTVCNLYYNEDKGLYITVECDDTCGGYDTTPYPDSVYSVYREK